MLPMTIRPSTRPTMRTDRRRWSSVSISCRQKGWPPVCRTSRPTAGVFMRWAGPCGPWPGRMRRSGWWTNACSWRQKDIEPMYRHNLHIHFVGIGGIGMSGIAELLLFIFNATSYATLVPILCPNK